MLLLVACTAEPAPEAPWFPPDQPGPSLVGTREGTVDSRTGISLDVQWWFPAAEVETEAYRYDEIWASPTAHEGRPSCSEQHPVLVFSHGDTAMRWQSYFLTEYLASHGWVVAAPDHRYNTVFDNDEDLKEELAARRPLDLADTYDDLLARNADPEDPLVGCIDPAAGYHVAGHSFGGYTALAIGGAVIDVAASRAECDRNGGWLCDLVPYYEENYGADAVIDGSDPRVLSIAP
ncbi:MAG TPA: alpha/beta fold hydrolase, partial [Myxococcota bacterium]|nr:alpha/beta fold hydrolase [Myxococcota bacterium]